jgi:hypothetical protein
MGWLPDFLKNLSTANYGMWDSPTPGLHPDGSVTPGEGGVDVGTPNGTPVYAIADGMVVGSGYWKDNGHGVVTTRVNVPGQGLQDLYYQHIQIAPGVAQGQQVHRGQLIGTIGPFNEIEMGFNARWGQPWGLSHPGPWIADPRPWIKSLLDNGGAVPMSNSASPSPNPITDSIAALWAGAVPTLQQWGEYIAIFVLAVILIIVGFVLIGGGPAISTAAKAVAG